jgi:hypothetical protein
MAGRRGNLTQPRKQWERHQTREATTSTLFPSPDTEQSPQCGALPQLMMELHAITEPSAFTRHRHSTFSYMNTEVNSSGWSKNG